MESFLISIMLATVLANTFSGGILLTLLSRPQAEIIPLDQETPDHQKPVKVTRLVRKGLLLLNMFTAAILTLLLLAILIDIASSLEPDIAVIMAGIFGFANSFSAIVLWWSPAPTTKEMRQWSHSMLWCGLACVIVNATHIIFFFEFMAAI